MISVFFMYIHFADVSVTVTPMSATCQRTRLLTMKSVDVNTTLAVLTARRAFLCTTTGLGPVRRNPVLMSASVSVSVDFGRTQSNMLLVKFTFENNLPYYTLSFIGIITLQ